jgi:hypothetical protein
VTPFGILICESDEQLIKHPFPREANEPGKLIRKRDEHPKKQQFGKRVSEFERVI